LLPAATATKLVHGPVALVETCFNKAIAGEAALTVSVLDAVLPVPPLVDETAPLVLAKVPTLAEVTLTVTVHVLPADTDPPTRLILFEPAVAVSVPLHVFVVLAGVVLSNTPGYISVKPTPVRALFKFGFDIVNVSVDVPPERIGLGENNFVMLGGFNTMSPAVALPVDPVLVPPFVDEINPLTF
jgi:hypothetical protein